MQINAKISINTTDGKELSLMVQPGGDTVSVEIIDRTDARARMCVKLNDLRALVIAAQRVLDAD